MLFVHGESDVIARPRQAGLLLDDSSADCCHKYALLSAESKSNGEIAAKKDTNIRCPSCWTAGGGSIDSLTGEGGERFTFNSSHITSTGQIA